MVNVLYDKALYLTDDEYFERTGNRVNIQTIVEKPELYIVARSRSNDEQLSYIETRLSRIIELKQKFYVNDIEITDKMRLFHGDGPSVQF